MKCPGWVSIRAAQTPTTATLAPDCENSVDWDTTQNVFIEGDNLEVLKILQKHYYSKIKMIYIDTWLPQPIPVQSLPTRSMWPGFRLLPGQTRGVDAA